MPFTDRTASKCPSVQGSSNIDPTRRSAVGVRSQATATSSAAASMPATSAPMPLATRTASPEPQATSRSEVAWTYPEPGEQCNQHVERIVLVEARPVEWPCSPTPPPPPPSGGTVAVAVSSIWGDMDSDMRLRPENGLEVLMEISWRRSSGDHHPIFMTCTRPIPDSGVSGDIPPSPSERKDPP